MSTDVREVDLTDRSIPASTCLGCGCTCDDIEIVVRGRHIVEAGNACSLGQRWYGGATNASSVRDNGREVPLSDGLAAAAMLLTSARRPLVYLAADASCETHREAIALADGLRARVESLTSSTAMPAAHETGLPPNSGLPSYSIVVSSVSFW